MAPFKELPQVQADGLAVADVGAWAEEKYRLVELYASLFCRAVRGKWDCLVYIDIFAGAGYARFKGTQRIVAGSPLIALGLEEKFDRYVFCEADDESAAALRQRCAREYPAERVVVILGDANVSAQDVVRGFPTPSKSNRVLGFCFVDPFKMANLKFATIEALSRRFMDFLVLIPSGMDAHRNEGLYVREENRTVDEFVGNPEWRSVWLAEKAKGRTFETFVVEEFGRSMSRLGYPAPSLDHAAVIRSDEKNLLLYRLMHYSKHQLAGKLWQQAKKYTNPQAGFEGF